MRKPFKRLIVAYIVTVLFPIIIFGKAKFDEKRSQAPELRGVGMAVAYMAVIWPGTLLDELMRDVFSRPYIKTRSIKELTASHIGKEAYVKGDKTRYQEDSLIIPISISGSYLRAVRVTPAAATVESLFTVGPYSYEDNHIKEEDFERELLNRGIIKSDEWNISEWNPLIWKTIRQHGRFGAAFKVKKDDKPVLLLALIEETVGRRSRDLWLFDPKSSYKPINLTAFSDSLERSIDNVEVSNDVTWIYIMGHIKLLQSAYPYDPLFARVTPSGQRDIQFEQEWKKFIDTSNFSRVSVDAVKELRNGCLIIAFSPHRETSYPVKWLRLAQKCGNNPFELLSNGEVQVQYENSKVSGVKIDKIYDLTNGNLLLKLNGWTVVKLNLPRRELDSDFQQNLFQTLRLQPLKGKEDSSIKYEWADIRFGMLTPHPWLIFHSYKETPKIIVTDIDGVKLFETDNF